MESMTAMENTRSFQSKVPVTIKGVRDGLLFILHDEFTFEEILQDLHEKLNGSQQKLFVGPIIHVTFVIGKRALTEEQEQNIRDCLSVHGNLIVQGFITEEERNRDALHTAPLVYKGTVRSGQVMQHTGDVIVIGDVNYGGQIIATGDIYVMGTLRGTVHAGAAGNRNAIIAAVYFQPTQLRIGNVISRSPDSNQQTFYGATEMEFAYLRDGQMAVDRMNHLNILRGQLEK